MKNHIMTYNQLNESNELDDLSFEEVERLADLGLLNGDLLKIYNYVKKGNFGDLNLVYSTLTHLPSWLVEVEGELILANSNIEDIPDSLKIKGGIFAINSKLKEFRRSVVFGDLDLDSTAIAKLPDGLIVHGYLSVQEVYLMELPKKLYVRDTLYMYHSSFMKLSTIEITKKYRIGTIERDEYR